SFAPGIRVERLPAAGSLGCDNLQAGCRPKTGDCNEHGADRAQTLLPNSEYGAAGYRAEDHGAVTAHLQIAVRLRQIVLAEQLRQYSVLGRTEERGLRGDQEHRENEHIVPSHEESPERQDHDQDLKELAEDKHSALVEPVGDEAGISGEE